MTTRRQLYNQMKQKMYVWEINQANYSTDEETKSRLLEDFEKAVVAYAEYIILEAEEETEEVPSS